MQEKLENALAPKNLPKSEQNGEKFKNIIKLPENLQSMGNSVVTKNRKWTVPKQSCLFHWGNSFQSPWRLPNRGCA